MDASPSIVNAIAHRAGEVRYEPFIDGIRALLASYVVLFHITLMLGHIFAEGDVLDARGYVDPLYFGHNAVVAFIFISGLCLGMPVVGNLEAGQPALRGGTRRFYLARARRILPAYYAVIGLGLIVSILATLKHIEFPAYYIFPVRLSGLIGSLCLVPNLVDHHNGVGVIWSLGVELQIYLVFPLLISVWRRAGIVALLGGVAAVVAMADRLLPPTLGPLILGGGAIDGVSPSFYFVFVGGLVGATVLTSQTAAFAALRRSMPWGVLLTLGMVAELRLPGMRWNQPCAANDYSVAVLMLLFVMAVQRHAALRWLLDRKPLVRVGGISYSLYLTHLVVFNIIYLFIYRPFFPLALRGHFLWAFGFHVIVGMPIMLAFAWIFSARFEKPFRNGHPRPATGQAVRHFIAAPARAAA